MDKYIDFTNCPVDPYKGFRGAKGKKISITYNNEKYMLKFQTPYLGKPTNSHVCEYLGCHIFNSLGIPAQETILGTYKDMPVVACKDFETDGRQLLEFAMLKNSIITSSEEGYGTELTDIMTTIKEQEIYPFQKLQEHFWNMYIADTLIGNFDRHNGNWGLLTSINPPKAELAPVYDCASSLYSRQTKETMESILSSPEEINHRIYVFPTAAMKIQNEKINYFTYTSSLVNSDCTAALKRIYPRINMEKINAIIDNTPHLSSVERSFYKEMLHQRKTKILDFSMEKLKEKERSRKLCYKGLSR